VALKIFTIKFRFPKFLVLLLNWVDLTSPHRRLTSPLLVSSRLVSS
jgi:hypothetical protein